ncbi:DNA gyrase inhibitor YacG [Eleftheria terrae]|uniref:DNA gyrase inhibitor YacG n=1 Tax=Eleftheria terrae TaxID=1597781 RepID=UPI00263B6AAF|nr:DNA gyrase inhibitor YacG [Eleftheria terrae]WKB54740.1 DNA gyrase inhibitor YacG [Eleftheria terrae]
MDTPAPPPPPRPRTVRCPACQGESLFSPENPWRPFCSQRCKNLDFGAWASESYRVGSPPGPQDPEGSDGEHPH